MDRVIGSYRLVRLLGEGGMGAVYLAEHTLLGRPAAVKLLLPELGARPEIVARLFTEARVTTQIRDPGIVQIFDFGYDTDGSAYLVMELLEGEPLDARLARRGRLELAEALRLMRMLATSLAAAHAAGIVHRDLKPENIFLVRDGEVAGGERPKLLDFGIAKLAADAPGRAQTHAGQLIGTPVYMSPEQCRGAQDLDHRSDIYAAGCVLFRLIAGAPPFDHDGVGALIVAHLSEPAPRLVGVPAAVSALVARCLAKAPADRFASMTELAAAIDLALGVTARRATTTLGDSVGELALPPPGIASGAPARARWGLGALAVVVLAAGVGGGVFALRPGGAPGRSSPAPVAIAASRPLPDAAAPIDAAPPAPPDAAPAPPAPPDAAAPPPPDAPRVRAGPSRRAAPRATCQHAVDPDCDGIPDLR